MLNEEIEKNQIEYENHQSKAMENSERLESEILRLQKELDENLRNFEDLKTKCGQGTIILIRKHFSDIIKYTLCLFLII